jgi:hypothetical protein
MLPSLLLLLAVCKQKHIALCMNMTNCAIAAATIFCRVSAGIVKQKSVDFFYFVNFRDLMFAFLAFRSYANALFYFLCASLCQLNSNNNKSNDNSSSWSENTI